MCTVLTCFFSSKHLTVYSITFNRIINNNALTCVELDVHSICLVDVVQWISLNNVIRHTVGRATVVIILPLAITTQRNMNSTK